MAEETGIGNDEARDEPCHAMLLPIAEMSLTSPPEQHRMSRFQRLFARLTAISSRRALCWLPVAATLGAVAVPGDADAARGRTGGAYDGTWNVVFATTRGNCNSGYSVPFTVNGSRVSSAGGGRVSGSVRSNGAVAVKVSVGASKATGGGRLAGTSGTGAWSGIITGDRCSGTWQATRS
jgi:hypothetical protein